MIFGLKNCGEQIFFVSLQRFYSENSREYDWNRTITHYGHTKKRLCRATFRQELEWEGEDYYRDTSVW